jgi:NodT family efflux transporter outer membrane factor (OMF) lipoprotein
VLNYRYRICALAMLSGCATQPPHANVPLATPAAWSVAADDVAASAPGQDAWWSQLNDHAIDVLTPAALADNPTLAQAIARVDEANADLGVRAAQRLPSLQANLGASRSHNPDGDTNTYATGATLGFALNWEIDLFGRVRGSVDGARHRLDARSADADAARLSLAARVADTVLALRGCRFSHAVLGDDIASREVTLELTRRKLAVGAVAAVDEARARSGLAAARTTLAIRQQQCSGHLNTLIALTGRDAASVEALMAEAVTEKSSAALPRYAEWLMPVAPQYRLALPAVVLARHPSVLAAEAELAAAWADIAVARAERLPRLDLGAALSGQWLRAGGGRTDGWSIGPALSMPLFDGGRGAAAVSAGEARYRLALAGLRGAVRNAARDVENALAATLSANTRLSTTRAAADAALAAFDATDAMWRAGAASLFVLEDARRQLASAQNDAIAAVQDSGQAWIALVLACGNSSIISESPPNEAI